MQELREETFGGTFPFAPHYLEEDGIDLHYVDVGTGAPVLMLHGDPSWGYLWRVFIAPLAESCRVVVPDHMGMGKSGRPPFPPPYRLAQHVENLERLVLRLDLRELTLVLHDWGGPIGLGVAARHPERIAGLVLMNTWAHARWPGGPFPRLVELIRSPRGEQFVLERNGYVATALRGTMTRPEQLDQTALDAYLAPYPTPESRQVLLSFSRDIPVEERDPSFAELHRTEQALPQLGDRPVLLVWGMQDPVLPPAVLARWRATYPRAEVCEIQDASHFLQEDAPENVLDCLTAFLRP
jgi:cis-3-alkyl-4-acyloxetan-2-one decarboxylase